ncbi:MAG: hypothetical protein N2202_09875 [Proteobacteria bacterium]|nr:hypothetical protein [Pseudomonadota bacterium]
MKFKKLLRFLILIIFCFFFCSTTTVLFAEQKKASQPVISNQPSSQPLPTTPSTIPTPQKRPEDTNINIPDIPVIKSFIISFSGAFSKDNQALAGAKPSLYFTWEVERGVGGSSISSIVVEKLEGPGPEVNFRTSELKGYRVFPVAEPLSSGRTIYKITATNNKGRSASSTAFIEVFSFRQAAERVQLASISMPETEMEKTFNLNLTFLNRNNFGVSFQILVYAYDGSTSIPIALRNSENPEGTWGIYLDPSSSKEINIPCKLPIRDERHYWKRIKIIITHGGEPATSSRNWEYPLIIEIKRVFRLTR